MRRARCFCYEIFQFVILFVRIWKYEDDDSFRSSLAGIVSFRRHAAEHTMRTGRALWRVSIDFCASEAVEKGKTVISTID